MKTPKYDYSYEVILEDGVRNFEADAVITYKGFVVFISLTDDGETEATIAMFKKSLVKEVWSKSND